METYEKAYKSVLQTAKQWIKDGCSDKEKICLECVFPELRESEDERIRKELIFFLKEEIPQCSIKEHADKLKEFVAWLEKQKDTSQEREQEDEKMLDSVIRIITQFDDLAHEPTFAGPKWTHPYTKELAWLKSICPQPKREWSEEDERIINALILELKTNPSVATTNGYKRADYIDWINNLRPSWKPSEEQLNALNFAITYMFSTKANPTVLRELYDDLLKLK